MKLLNFSARKVCVCVCVCVYGGGGWISLTVESRSAFFFSCIAVWNIQYQEGRKKDVDLL